MNTLRYPLLFVFILLWLPFALNTRYLPYASFFQDISSGCIISTVLLLVAYSKKLSSAPPRISVYFLLLAIYWLIQPLLIDFSYENRNIRVALFFSLLSGLSWAIESLSIQLNKKVVLTWVMRGLVLGALIQVVSVIMQITGWAAPVSWLFFYNPPEIQGQFGQRNLLGHYLMWGTVATSYLISIQAIKKWQGIVIMVLISGTMGMLFSRAIILYLIVLFLLMIIFKIINYKKLTISIAPYFWGAISVLLAQWLAPILLSYSLDFNVNSGLDKLQISIVSDASNRGRFEEWHKAWLLFSEHPIWGAGWDTYTYYSFDKDAITSSDTLYHIQGAFQHCHNSVLQILAEMGLFGSLFVFGGLLWVTLPILKHNNQTSNFAILLLLAVSCAHSLVEFPLWNSYFLTAFVIFLSLGASASTKKNQGKLPILTNKSIICIALLGVLTCAGLLLRNQLLVAQYTNKQNYHPIDANMYALLDMGEEISLFKDYGDLKVIIQANPFAMSINQREQQVVANYAHYEPSSIIANLHALFLYRQGKVAEATQWLEKAWHYYPRSIPYSLKTIYSHSPMFSALEQPVYKACQQQQKQRLYPDTFATPCRKLVEEARKTQSSSH